MKHIAFCTSLIVLTIAGLFATPSVAQSSASPTPSLGDYARAVRKDKDKDGSTSTARHFDNDNLPQDNHISVVGAPPEEAAAKSAGDAMNDDKAASAGADKDKIKPIAPGQSPEERKKIYDEWQKKIDAKKGRIDALAQELDLAQREYRVHAADSYADPAARLRNPAIFAQQNADYQQKIDDKQKAIDAAKQELDDTQEDARKAGTPSSVRD